MESTCSTAGVIRVPAGVSSCSSRPVSAHTLSVGEPGAQSDDLPVLRHDHGAVAQHVRGGLLLYPPSRPGEAAVIPSGWSWPRWSRPMTGVRCTETARCWKSLTAARRLCRQLTSLSCLSAFRWPSGNRNAYQDCDRPTLAGERFSRQLPAPSGATSGMFPLARSPRSVPAGRARSPWTEMAAASARGYALFRDGALPVHGRGPRLPVGAGRRCAASRHVSRGHGVLGKGLHHLGALQDCA